MSDMGANVVVGSATAAGEPQPVMDPTKEAPRKAGAPKWEIEAKDRIKATIRKITKPLEDMVARDANEGDTRLIITDFLTDGLGYDKYQDLTTEYAVKGDFADYGVRIDKELVAFIEVKRCTTKLSVKHLRQVEMYAVNEGVEWIVLTNGVRWQCYHLTGGLPIIIDLAFDVDLLGPDTIGKKTNELFYLSRESLKRRQIDELWKAKAATAPKVLAAAVISDPVVAAIRKEVRRATGFNADSADIAKLLRDTVIQPGCLS